MQLAAKKTSLTVGIRLVAAGDVAGLITAGDTGTLVTAARLFMKPILPSKHTALMTKLPTLHSPVLLADVGAYVNAKAEHFLDFARLGTALLKAEGQKNIKMAMLNIGRESTKGPLEWTRAYQLLKKFSKEAGIKFAGNIEACDLFMEDLHLVITDALAGNILLKTAEGVAKMVMKATKGRESPSWLDWSVYPGALLAGLESPIIKVHGYSNEKAFTSALTALHQLLEQRVIAKMQSLL